MMVSGIYAILNLANGKYYIGSASDFQDRWRLHMLELNRSNHHNRHLQKAWLKYGQEQFKFVIVEECEIELLLEREQFFIDKLESTHRHKGYNICGASRNRSGVKISEETRERLRISHTGHKHSEETKKRMSASKKGNTVNNGRVWAKETVEKRASALRGKPRSAETIAKISAANTGKKRSDETRLKQSIAAKARRQRERENDDKPLDYTCDMWV